MNPFKNTFKTREVAGLSMKLTREQFLAYERVINYAKDEQWGVVNAQLASYVIAGWLAGREAMVLFDLLKTRKDLSELNG